MKFLCVFLLFALALAGAGHGEYCAYTDTACSAGAKCLHLEDCHKISTGSAKYEVSSGKFTTNLYTSADCSGSQTTGYPVTVNVETDKCIAAGTISYKLTSSAYTMAASLLVVVTATISAFIL